MSGSVGCILCRTQSQTKTDSISGPQSCLCSEVAACENTGDNEVDYLTNIFQAKSVYVEWEILSPFLGGKLPGTLCQQP